MTNNKEEQVWHREVITPEVEQTLQDLERKRHSHGNFQSAGSKGGSEAQNVERALISRSTSAISL